MNSTAHPCRNFAHLRSLWYVSLSQTVLWFTYCKAVFNSVLSQLGMKVLAFKATTKKVTDTAAAPAPVVVKAEAGHDKLSGEGTHRGSGCWRLALQAVCEICAMARSWTSANLGCS